MGATLFETLDFYGYNAYNIIKRNYIRRRGEAV